MVAVSHPAAASRQSAVVLSSNDQVTDSDACPSCHGQAVAGDLTGGDPVGSGAGVEGGYGAQVGGDHKTRLSGVDVCPPGPVQGLEQFIAESVEDPTMRHVGVDHCVVAGAEAEAGLALPLGTEAADLAQFRKMIPIGDQGREHASGIYRAELRPVTNEKDLGPGIARRGDQLVESERSREGCFVDNDQLAGPEVPARHLGSEPGEASTQGHRGVGRR